MTDLPSEPPPDSHSSSTSVSTVAGRPRPLIEAAYGMTDLDAIVACYHDGRTRDGEWLAIARTIGEALGRPDVVDPTLRPEAVGRRLPPATVFLLGATKGPTPGCLGHLAARPANWTIGAGGGATSVATISGGHAVADAVLDVVMEAVRDLAPEVRPPELDIVVPMQGEGDSHALAAGIAAMHALLRGPVPRGLAATGGFDAEAKRFRPVPVETLEAKIAAARRWGVRRLVVVAGQAFPAGCGPEDLGDLDVLEVADDPGELPLLVLALASATNDAAAPVDAWRRALALYDLRVARRRSEPIESVRRTTAPFVVPMLGVLGIDVDDGAAVGHGPPPDTDAIRVAVRDSGVDPVLVGLAADIRSRVHLHAGRTVASAWWNAIAIALRGLGDLPDGLLGDHLLYQQPSHRSMLALDLGVLDDPAEGEDDGSDASPHGDLDRAIADLDGRWRTRHQSLLALFATNSRWRRRLYRARRDLDREAFDLATRDLLRWGTRWHELVEAHARVGLGMADTDLARQRNYVVEHAVTEVALLEPDAFARDAVSKDTRRRVAGHWAGEVERSTGVGAELATDFDGRFASPDDLGVFDLRALLQWRWLIGDDHVPASVVTRCRHLVEQGGSLAAIGVAEWWRRLQSPEDSTGRAVVHAALQRWLAPHLIGDGPASGDERSADGPAGVPRIVALRHAATLDLDGVAPPRAAAGAATWVESVAPPTGPATLRRLFDDLASRPSSLLVRTPY